MYIGIDLGGTNIVAGLTDEQGHILNKKSRRTQPQRGADAIVDDMASMCRELIELGGLAKQDIQWIGVGSPGTIDAEKGMIVFSGNLQLRNAPIADMLSARAALPVYVGNDANAAALGEVYAGAAKDCSIALMVTIGTGIGGGIVIDRRIYTGFNGMAGEIGHMVIMEGGRLCTCGRHGCWEAYASATGLIALTRESMQAHPESAMWSVAGTLENAGGRTSFDAMRLGDASGKQVVDDFIRYFACGLANITDVLQPEVICIGGGVSHEGDALLRPLQARFEQETFDTGGRNAKLILAALGNDAGLIGAAMLGHQAH